MGGPLRRRTTDCRPPRVRMISLSPPSVLRRRYRDHRYVDRHAEIISWRADKAAGDGDCLTDVTRDRNAYQVAAADRPVRWVVSDPAGARKIDVGPRVRSPRARCSRGMTIGRRIVQIPGHGAC